MSINSQTKASVDAYRQLLNKENILVEALILFGSQAKGSAKPWSDIDLCVVSRDFGHDRPAERMKLLRISNDETIDIEPHPYHPKDLADKWDPLAVEINKYGVTV